MAAAAKSNALQLEMELNEVLCDASVDEERGLPSMCVMKKCLAVLERLAKGRAFGPYSRVMALIQPQLVKGIQSERISTDENGEMTRLPHMYVNVELENEMATLRAEHNALSKLMHRVGDEREEMRQRNERLVQELEESRARIAELDEEAKEQSQLVDQLTDDMDRARSSEVMSVRQMTHAVLSTKQELHESEQARVELQEYVTDRESKRKAFEHMQKGRRVERAAERDEGVSPKDELQARLPANTKRGGARVTRVTRLTRQRVAWRRRR